MKVIIHDLREGEALSQEKSDKDSVVIHANNQYAPCCGCFKCWLKNAGFCIMKDSLQHIGALIGQSDPLIIVSQCCYGGYSSPVKAILDRAIGGLSHFLPGGAGKLTTLAVIPIGSCCVFIFMGNARNLKRR